MDNIKLFLKNLASCASEGRETNIEIDGKRIESGQAPQLGPGQSWEDCRNMCKNKSSCKYWTYIHASYTQENMRRRCYMRSTMTKKRTTTKCSRSDNCASSGCVKK